MRIFSVIMVGLLSFMLGVVYQQSVDLMELEKLLKDDSYDEKENSEEESKEENGSS